MNAAQVMASSRFIAAMGPMIEDEQKLNEVLAYIESIKTQPHCRPLSIDPNFKEKPMYTSEEYWDMFAKELGKHYSMADIRDAK